MAYNDETEYGWTNDSEFTAGVGFVNVSTVAAPIKVGQIVIGVGAVGILAAYHADGTTPYFSMRFGTANTTLIIPPLEWPDGLRFQIVGSGYFDILYSKPRL